MTRTRRATLVATLAHWQRRARSGGLPWFVPRAVLHVLSWLYGLATWARNQAFDAGILRAHGVDVPVVSVGNLAAGGTGKTPFVILLARAAQRSGIRVSVLTRGYRRGRSGAGEADEVALLRSMLPGVRIEVDANRVRGARRLAREGAELVLLDDGFQHRRLRRDVDVVLLDASEPFAGGLLPLGRLREPKRGLCRATVAILTRCARAGDEAVGAAREAVRRIAPRLPVLTADHVPVGLVGPGGSAGPVQGLRGRSVLAFSGIADPDALAETAALCGASVVEAIDFGDHFEYRPRDVSALVERASRTGAEWLLTTEKDLARLPAASLALPVIAIRVAARLRTSEERRILTSLLGWPEDALATPA